MKKYYKLIAFASVLTMLFYAGCGASGETNSAIADAPAVAEAGADDGALSPAVAENADGGDAVGYEEYVDIAVEADGMDGADDALADAGSAPELSPELSLAEAKDAFSSLEGAGEINSAEIAPAEAPAPEDDVIVEPEPVPEPEPETTPERLSAVGMLTAGQWNDHENWGFFSNLVNTGLVSFPSFGIDPTQRIAVTVTDTNGTPLPNIQVSLNNDTETIWKAVTDKNGNAYVFEMNGKTGANLTVSNGEASETIEIQGASVDEQGNALTDTRAYTIRLDTGVTLHHDTQIMFIVDTTGSMGDEMLYLQSDFSAIAEEAGDGNTTYSVNFYKDEGDEYITNCSGFTGDVSAIKGKLNSEYASGGGDEPEAVYEVLKETVFSPDWKDESVKIAFLIYDAPPHDDKEFEEIISEASAKGIHIVPVVSSNGSRETELFGRALAICTNGEYVFLTDDSGIGGSHLEPIIGDYTVEPLHDIIVRIIQEYKQ